MSDEHTVSLQSSMQFLPTRRLVVVLQTLEEQFPERREIMLSAMCLCADKRIVSSYSEDLYVPKNKMFYRNHMILLFSVVSYCKDDFLYL